MTRRLTAVIVATVLMTLVLAGVGTLLVARLQARTNTDRELRTQVVQLAQGLREFLEPQGVAVGNDSQSERELNARVRQRLGTLRRFGEVLELDDIFVALVNSSGRVTGGLPAEVPVSPASLDAMRRGQVYSGTAADDLFAATAISIGRNDAFSVVVVATRKPDTGVGPARRWFMIASLVTLALGALVGGLLGRRLGRPIRETSAVAQRIAAGDLHARVPAPDPGDHDEVAELQRSVNHMAESLRRSQQLETEFLMSVSHDLRTPLTSIRGYAEAISDGAGDPRTSAAVIRSEAQRLERLVGDLLDLGRMRAAGFSLRADRVDLSAVAMAASEALRPTADRHAVVVDVQLAGTPKLVLGDYDRLCQIVTNLIDNALRYARTRVHLLVTDSNGYIEMTVADDGPGIAEQDLAHVFERLYRASHQPLRKENSSGLGLAIVMELVTAMGGTITAGRSAQLGGAAFVVRLVASS